jgi:hypothetical protein
MPGATIEVNDDVDTGSTQQGQTSADATTGQGGADSTGQQPAAQAASVPASTPEPSSQTTQQATQQQPAEQMTDLLDYARTMGVDLSGQFQDSRQAFAGLLGAWQERQALAPYQQQIQQYVQHAPQFNQWLQQEQARQQQAQASKSPWSPPGTAADIQRLMAAHYERDPQSGAVKPRADCPLDVRQKVEAYQQYIADWQFKLQHDPMAALQPMIAQEAQKIAQQSLAQYGEQLAAQQMVQRNADWLYQRDGNNNQIYANGQPALSREGQIFAAYVREAETLGIHGVANQEKYALKHVHADLLFERQAPTQQQQQQNQQFLNQNNRRAANTGAAVANANGQTQTAHGMALRDMLQKAFEAEGITDKGIEEDLARAA